MSRGGFVAVVVLGSLSIGSGQAQGAGAFTARADARLVAVDVTLTPSVLFDQLVDAGYTVAQAQLDSLGNTAAFASNLYPGSSVVGLPGLLAGLAPLPVQIPPYPMVASSNAARSSERRDLGVLSLKALSTSTSSRGDVDAGGTQGYALTTVDDDGTVHATAETSIGSIRLGELLTLHGVRSSAEVTQRPGAEPVRTSTFEVGALEILGQRISVGPDELDLLGTKVPGGLGRSILSTLVHSLSQEGITFEYLPAVETETGITSAGLRILTTLQVPPDVASGIDTADVGITLGRSDAAVTAGAEEELSDGSAGGITDGGVTPDLTSSDGSFGSLTPLLPSSPVSPSAPKGPAEPIGGELVVAPVDLSVDGIYPYLMVAAALGALAATLFRHLGVRDP